MEGISAICPGAGAGEDDCEAMPELGASCDDALLFES